MSVINVNVVKRQPNDKDKTRAVGANGTPLDVVGQTTVSIQQAIGDFKVNHQFIVVNNLTVDCLLGVDFLQMHGAILDCCSNTLSVGQDFKVQYSVKL